LPVRDHKTNADPPATFLRGFWITRVGGQVIDAAGHGTVVTAPAWPAVSKSFSATYMPCV